MHNFHVSKIFPQVSYSYLKFSEKHDENVPEPVRPTVLQLCPNYVQKWDPELTKILTLQFWWWIRIRLDLINTHDCRFLQFQEIWEIDQKKCPYYSKGILYNFHVSKIFGDVPYPYLKFDGKHDGNGPEPVWLTVLELWPNFVQKWGPEPAEMGWGARTCRNGASSVLMMDSNSSVS